jgi:hypothetical protein
MCIAATPETTRDTILVGSSSGSRFQNSLLQPVRTIQRSDPVALCERGSADQVTHRNDARHAVWKCSLTPIQPSLATIMNDVAKALSDPELDALTECISGL